MKHLRIIQTAACAALLFAALMPRSVKADEWDKKTIISFSDTVQVPGTTLPAGKYVFKLVESNANRYVVQVFNERENHVFATLIAIPNYHMNPPDKTLISFYEVPKGNPEPIKAWFYPGDNYGRQFVYKKSEAAMIAKMTKETVLTDESTTVAVSTETTTEQTAQAAVTEPQVESTKVVEPIAEPTPEPLPEPKATVDTVTTATTVEEPKADTDGVASETVTPEATTMPATGSELPLAGLIGLSAIAGAVALRAARRSS